MSKTLFWYIFRQLIWIFFTASGALAGMMSFGGLLRPLTKNGLGLSEIGITLVNLMPVMSTYAFPVAALFATTLVYGRLSSENELVAMRAGGISHLHVALPAIVMGLGLFCLSLYMLCFVVPPSTLRVEKVITANFARMLVTSIERTHEYNVKDGPVISAQQAQLQPPDVNDPSLQVVVLKNPFIVSTYEDFRTDENGERQRVRVPREFYSADRATVFIKNLPKSDDVEITVKLDSGISFQRKLAGAVTGGIAETQYGPIVQPLPLAEKPKFMDVHHLRELYAEPDSAKRVRDEAVKVNRIQQIREVFNALGAPIRSGVPASFTGTDGQAYVITAPPGSTSKSDDKEMVIYPPAGKTLRFEASRKNNTSLIIDAGRLAVRPNPDNASGTIELPFAFDDAAVRNSDADDVSRAPKYRARNISVRMTPEIAAIGQRTASEATHAAQLPEDLRRSLGRALILVNNEVRGELNARAAFATACVVLVVMGACLGMMFRSGHFLTAFGISVGPALICILLTVTGQHTVESVPSKIPLHWVNPLTIGTCMIWSGNAIVGAVALALLVRLQKQ